MQFLSSHLLALTFLVVALLLEYTCQNAETRTFGVLAMKPTRRYLKSMEDSMEALEELSVCRAQHGHEWLRDAMCFDAALRHAPFNATWAKQAGANYLMSSLIRQSTIRFNDSVVILAEGNGFISPQTGLPTVPLGTLGAVKLYYAREKDGGVEFAKANFEQLHLAGNVTDARAILQEFMRHTHDPSAVGDLYRSIGDFVAAVRADRDPYGRKRRTAPSLLASLVEEVPFAMETAVNMWLRCARCAVHMKTESFDDYNHNNGFPSSIKQYNKDACHQLLVDLRERCGSHRTTPTLRSDAYDLAEVLEYAVGCLRHANITRVGAVANAEVVAADDNKSTSGVHLRYMALDRSLVHTAAYIGLRDVVHGAALHNDSVWVSVVDNLGRIPMHYAAAGHQVSLMWSMELQYQKWRAKQQSRSDDDNATAATSSRHPGSGMSRTPATTIYPKSLLLVKDAGGVTPLAMICGGVSRSAFEVEARMAVGGHTTSDSSASAAVQLHHFKDSPTKCSGVSTEFAQQLIDEEDGEDDDEQSLRRRGGWLSTEAAKSRHLAVPEEPNHRCKHIDVRDVSGISHTEMVGRYLSVGVPVVLRKVPLHIRKALACTQLLSKFANVSVRIERMPTSERYGWPCDGASKLPKGWQAPLTPSTRVSTIRDARNITNSSLLECVATLSSAVHAADQTLISKYWATIEAPKRHPLNTLLEWTPDAVLPKKDKTKAKTDSDKKLVVLLPSTHKKMVWE